MTIACSELLPGVDAVRCIFIFEEEVELRQG
jgi:hypothetical protein